MNVEESHVTLNVIKLKTVPDHVIFVFSAYSNYIFCLHSGADQCTKTCLWSFFPLIFWFYENIHEKICKFESPYLFKKCVNFRELFELILICIRIFFKRVAKIDNMYFNTFRGRIKTISKNSILECQIFWTLPLYLRSCKGLQDSRWKAAKKEWSGISNAWRCCCQNRDSWRLY